jgi:hypothetical protein
MKFKNLKTGHIETVTNEALIEQYERYTEVYELVDNKKAEDNKEKSKDNKKAEDNKDKE